MNYTTYFIQGFYPLAMKKDLTRLLLSALFLLGLQILAQAQPSAYDKPTFWFGAAAGANLNYYRGSTQQLNSSFTAPAVFTKGNGAGLYVAPLIEAIDPKSGWGVMLQVGYDGRHSEYNQVKTPCNCPADLSMKLSYITVEPSLRLAPFKSNFYLYGGPRMAFNVQKSFNYQLGVNPAYPTQAASPAVKGDLSNIHKGIISMQIGAGYDIPLSPKTNRFQTVLSPFVSYQPYFGQAPRSIETWNITTLRVGAALKFGVGKKIMGAPSNVELVPNKVAQNAPEVQFYVTSPKNIPTERRVRETFPLRNYVFFDLGSTEIPGRYVLLAKNQVKDFKEEQLEVFAPKKLTGRSDRGMVVYYNLLNILGDRMDKNPSTTITLVGSSEKGPIDGRAMAESIKKYLVGVFGIDETRIGIEGRNKPEVPSEQLGGTKELNLLREGDRRVTIESTSPALLMEFQTGPELFLRPIEITNTQEAPFDSYVSFYVKGGDEALTTWSLETRDEQGKVQTFGPFMQEHVNIAGKTILGDRPGGRYVMTMIGQQKDGAIIKKENTVNMVLWTPPKNEEGMRYSIIYEFNESKTNALYEKYLLTVVIPKIPKDGMVIIHGHTDVIGDAPYNLKLSLARAVDVKNILEKGLLKIGRMDVTLVATGVGEDETLSPYDNNYPEERFYNRTVILDIIPKN